MYNINDNSMVCFKARRDFYCVFTVNVALKDPEVDITC